MDVQQAHTHIQKSLEMDVGRFYGMNPHLPLGAGLFYNGIRFPVFDTESRTYLTAEGLVCILTHECDISQDNDRIFNEAALICPIMRLEDFVAEYSFELSDNALKAFLDALAHRRVSRVIYIPPMGPPLEYGGLINLNEIAHTHISEFQNEGAEQVISLSAYGLEEIDKFIRNHLLRPKSTRLPLED